MTLNQILKDRKALQMWRKGGGQRSPSGGEPCSGEWGNQAAKPSLVLGNHLRAVRAIWHESICSYAACVHVGMGESPPENLICQHPGLRGEKQKPASR